MHTLIGGKFMYNYGNFINPGYSDYTPDLRQRLNNMQMQQNMRQQQMPQPYVQPYTPPQPVQQPAYITCSPYVASNVGWGCAGSNTLPVEITIGSTTYPMYTRSGNLLRADQLRCRKLYPIIFGTDPNHFSLVNCVPNTAYSAAPATPTT